MPNRPSLFIPDHPWLWSSHVRCLDLLSYLLSGCAPQEVLKRQSAAGDLIDLPQSLAILAMSLTSFPFKTSQDWWSTMKRALLRIWWRFSTPSTGIAMTSWIFKSFSWAPQLLTLKQFTFSILLLGRNELLSHLTSMMQTAAAFWSLKSSKKFAKTVQL